MTSAAGVTYTYDGNGLRVEKSNGTLYWRSLSGDAIAETDLSGNTVSEYVFFAGRRVSRLDSSARVFYYFADPLGNTRTITDSTGHACYDADFTPYGQEIVHTNTCPQNYKFTGYERDPGGGGLDQGAALAADATAHALPSIGAQVAIGTMTSIGTAISHTSGVYNPVTVGVTTARFGATTVGKLGLGALEGVLTGKVLLDAGVYVGALVVCSIQ